MAQYGRYQMYQTLHEDEALQIALSESMHLYHSLQEQEDLALAIQMSLINEAEGKLDCPKTNFCSDLETVKWDPDDVINPDDTSSHSELLKEVEGKTLIQDCEDQDEIKAEIEFSMRIDEDSSDDENHEPEGADNFSRASSELDIWKEFQEMSVLSFTSTLPADPVSETESAEYTFDSENPQNVIHCSSEHKVETSKLTELPSEELITLDNPNHFLNDDSLPVKDFTLQNDMVTIPHLGTFKRKKHFSCLASNELIKKMLSQTSAEPGRQCKPHSLSANYASVDVLKTYDPNIPNGRIVTPKPVSQKPHVSHTIGSTSTISSTEEERRSRLYNSIVHAQRRYAEKISTPMGSGHRFTKAEWESLGENLRIEDWEAGFVQEDVCYESLPSKHLKIKKENMSASWKGKEKAVEVDMDGESQVLQFGDVKELIG